MSFNEKEKLDSNADIVGERRLRAFIDNGFNVIEATLVGFMCIIVLFLLFVVLKERLRFLTR